MPKFTYTVKDKAGTTLKNFVEAHSEKAVIDHLQKQGYFIISVKQLNSQGPTKKKVKKKNSKKFKRKKVKEADLISFSRQLATMLEAGVALIRSIDVILTQIQSQRLFEILSAVKKDIEGGHTLSLSLARHPDVFNPFWVSLVEVGEASGTIPTVLNKLTFYMEQQAKFKSTIISGIIYPAILFAVSIGAVTFFALFVGPRFESIFTQMGTDLPLITVLLLDSFRFLKTNFLAIIAAHGVAIFLLTKYLKTYHGRTMYERFMSSLPTVGEVYRLIIVERFASQMSILIDAGVPILYALEIAERLVDNNTCALVVSSIKDGVKQGELLVAPMERSGFFPPMCVQMVMVGEETGELSKMLKHISAFYQDQVETFMNRFATIVEPFMLIFMGGIIGTIVLAMFLPMFNLSQGN